MKFLLLLSFQDYIIFAYGLIGFISFIGYGPQIWTLIKSTGRSMSTPISTWCIWFVEAGVAFLYALFILQDFLAQILFGVDVMAAGAILALTVYNRHYRFNAEKEKNTILKINA